MRSSHDISKDPSNPAFRKSNSTQLPPSGNADMHTDHLPVSSFHQSWPTTSAPWTQRSYGTKPNHDLNGQQVGNPPYAMRVDASYGGRDEVAPYHVDPQFDPVDLGYPESSQRTHVNEIMYPQGYNMQSRNLSHRHQQHRTEAAVDRIAGNGALPVTYGTLPGTRAVKPSVNSHLDTRMSSTMQQRVDLLPTSPSPLGVDGHPRSLSSLPLSTQRRSPQTPYNYQAFPNSFDPVRDSHNESLYRPCVDSNEVAKSDRLGHPTSHSPPPVHGQGHWSLSSLDSSLHSGFSDQSYGVAPGSENLTGALPESGCPGGGSFPMTLASGSHGSFSNNDSDSSTRVKKTKMHQCDVCQKWFPRPSGLATHMNSHSGAKPFKCVVEGCDKSFTVRSNAKRHLRTHGVIPDSEPTDNRPQFNIGFHTPQVSHVHELAKPPQKLRWVPQSPEARMSLNWLQSSPTSDSDGEDDVMDERSSVSRPKSVTPSLAQASTTFSYNPKKDDQYRQKNLNNDPRMIDPYHRQWR